MTSHWSPAAVAAIAGAPLPETPSISRSARLLPGLDLWDYWPVQELDGRVAAIDGRSLYFVLSAPAIGDPDHRHDRAHLRAVHDAATGWRDLGPIFPDGFAPGSRQWSGSTVIDPDHRRLTLFFTAAGHRGEAVLGFEQRLFTTEAPLSGTLIGDWTPPVEVVAPGSPYMREMSGGGATGTIKAFRDPFFFRDPVDETDYLMFSASLAASRSPWNGTVGVARRNAGDWTLMPALIAADGLNNELERPHVIFNAGLYYCFWSTQAKVFAAGGPAGPTGLYGMVAGRMAGPWRPLNGTGLVVANPASAPHQAYSWLVAHDLSVLSFADMVGIDRTPGDAVEARRHFGGTPAPMLRLRLDGERATLA